MPHRRLNWAFLPLRLGKDEKKLVFSFSSLLESHFVLLLQRKICRALKRHLTIISLLLAMSCWLGCQANVVDTDAAQHRHVEERIDASQICDKCARRTDQQRRWPFEAIFDSPSPLSHVVFMRPSRTAASQSCQQERGLLWLAAVETKYLQKKSLLHLLCAGLHIAGISSPRFYYVIALRRILC